MLPCTSIDEMAEFGQLLGLQVTYRQVRPNPYLALEGADGLVLHYFALEGLAPEDSYSTCGVVVDDPGRLFDEFAAGLRAKYGKLPLTGYPRITRPRRRKNAENRIGVQPGRSGGELDPGHGRDGPAQRGLAQGQSTGPGPRQRCCPRRLPRRRGPSPQDPRRSAARHNTDADPQVRAEAEAFLAELADGRSLSRSSPENKLTPCPRPPGPPPTYPTRPDAPF